MLRDKLRSTLGGGDAALVKGVASDKSTTSIEQVKVYFYYTDDPVGSAPLPAPTAPPKSCLRSPARKPRQKKVRLTSFGGAECAAPQVKRRGTLFSFLGFL
jgi:hypothetical protein